MPTMTPALTRADTAPQCGCDARLIDPNLMFPAVDSERPARPNSEERAALAVCARCPVLAQCAEDVLELEMPYGVAGKMTAADRRAVRARRRGPLATSSDAPVTVCSASPTPAGVSTTPSATVESVVRAVLAGQAHFAHEADPARVTALTTPRGPVSASRWEVALAAVAALRLGRSVSATARHLGEQPTQVKRWQDRDQAGESLVRSPGGAGTSQLSRPSAATAASTSTASREQDRSAA